MELVKSNAQVAINKNSDPVQKFFLRDGWGGQRPNSNFLDIWNCPKRARKHIFWHQVNIDKANRRRYDVTR